MRNLSGFRIVPACVRMVDRLTRYALVMAGSYSTDAETIAYIVCHALAAACVIAQEMDEEQSMQMVLDCMIDVVGEDVMQNRRHTDYPAQEACSGAWSQGEFGRNRLISAAIAGTEAPCPCQVSVEPPQEPFLIDNHLEQMVKTAVLEYLEKLDWQHCQLKECLVALHMQMFSYN